MSFVAVGKASCCAPKFSAIAKPEQPRWCGRLSSPLEQGGVAEKSAVRNGRSALLDQAYWRARETSRGSLQYLSWGSRHYGSSPVTETGQGGWMYIVIEGGAVTLEWGDRREQIRGPALVLIGPECMLNWAEGALHAGKHLAWVWRSPVHAVMARLRKDAVVHYALGASDVGELRHLHALCRSEIFRGDLHSEAALSGLQSLLEARIARIGEGCTDDPRKEIIDRALNWIEAHMSARQPLARLADFLGVSPATVQRLFRERLGTTVMKSVAELRRREAERMLKSDGASIKEIAYRLGYRHPHDFSRAFRNHTGKLPSHWAARMEASS